MQTRSYQIKCFLNPKSKKSKIKYPNSRYQSHSKTNGCNIFFLPLQQRRSKKSFNPKQFSLQNGSGMVGEQRGNRLQSYYKMSWGKPIFHYRMTCQKSSGSFHPRRWPLYKMPTIKNVKIFKHHGYKMACTTPS